MPDEIIQVVVPDVQEVITVIYENVIDRGETGPQGPPGTSDAVINLVCGEDITSGLAVAIKPDGKLYKYDVMDAAFFNLTSGIARQSGTAGTAIDISLYGTVTDPGSGWAIGNDYYVGLSGVLQNTPPVGTTIIKSMGTGIGPDRIFINKQIKVLTI